MNEMISQLQQLSPPDMIWTVGDPLKDVFLATQGKLRVALQIRPGASSGDIETAVEAARRELALLAVSAARACLDKILMDIEGKN